MHGRHHMFRRRKRGHSGECCFNDLCAGERATILSVHCESAERGKLCSLGILPGAQVEAGHAMPGKRCLRIHGSALALDDNLAAAITCSPECRCCNTEQTATDNIADGSNKQ